MVSWFKSISPVNSVIFPGAGRPSSYQANGEPFAGRFKDGTTTLVRGLLWVPQDSADDRLPALLVAREDPKLPSRFLVIHFHGNACDVGEQADVAYEQAKAWRSHVLMPEYPGFGIAPGSPSEESIDGGAQATAQFAIDVLKVQPAQIIVFGWSVGTGPAVALAAFFSKQGTPPAALIIQSPFTSVRDVAAHHVPILGSLVLDRWNTQDTLCDVRAPIWIMHSKDDEVIPYEHGQRLYAARASYQGHCELHTLSGATHVSFDLNRDVLLPVSRFLEKHVAHVRVLRCQFQALARDGYVQAPSGSTSPQKQSGGFSLGSALSGMISSSLAVSGALVHSSAAATGKASGYSVKSSVQYMGSGPMLRKAFVPLSGSEGTVPQEERRSTEEFLNGQTISLRTNDGVQLDALWCVPDRHNNGKAALIFHGNGMVLDSMRDFAAWYLIQGFHALLITIRGYPGSGGDSAKDGERGMYQDASAAFRFVTEAGFSPNDILAHGYSLGGSLAAAVALYHGIGALTLDHTFTSAKDVAQNIARVLPGFLVEGAVGGAYPAGKNIDLGDGLVVTSDGLNILAKVEKYSGALFVFYGARDEMMPISFASDFVQARYSEGGHMDPPVYAALDGSHVAGMFFEDDVAKERYWQHLCARFFGSHGEAFF